MKKIISVIVFFGILCTIQCSVNNTDPDPVIPDEEGLYFPPDGSEIWETLTTDELGWNTGKITELVSFLANNETKAFIILKNGKLVVEQYFDGLTASSNWYWASAAKTLTAFMVGVAQYEGYLNLDDPSSVYLGSGWSSLTMTQEDEITIAHHLTMTTGLDYNVADIHCTDPNCLQYLNVPGDYWYYHNAPYTLLQPILSGALNTSFDAYFNEKLRNRIGMQGSWHQTGYNRLFISTARSMARFGLLCLNNGIWDQQVILPDTNYFESMVTTSQQLNRSYGYLWWLNGKGSFKLPGLTATFTGNLIPNAPNDLIAGMGANDQKLYVVPSQNLVIVRMGNDAGEERLGPSSFDNQLWEKINAVIN